MIVDRCSCTLYDIMHVTELQRHFRMQCSQVIAVQTQIVKFRVRVGAVEGVCERGRRREAERGRNHAARGICGQSRVGQAAHKARVGGIRNGRTRGKRIRNGARRGDLKKWRDEEATRNARNPQYVFGLAGVKNGCFMKVTCTRFLHPEAVRG